MRRTADRHPAARTRSNRALIVFVAVFFLMGLGAIAPMGAGLLASAGASEEGTDQTAILDDEYAMKREDDSGSDASRDDDDDDSGDGDDSGKDNDSDSHGNKGDDESKGGDTKDESKGGDESKSDDTKDDTPPPDDDPPDDDPPGDDPPGDDPPGDDPPGDDPPGDDPPGDDPPGDDPPGDDPPGDDPPGDAPKTAPRVVVDTPASDEVLGVVVSRGDVSGEAAELGEELPFTGFDLASALMAAGMFLAVGGGARALSRRRAD